MTKARHASLAIQGTGQKEIRRIRTWHRLRLSFLVIFLVLLGSATLAMMRQKSEALALAADTKNQGKHYATVTHAEPAKTDQTISLPGTLLGQI